MKLKVLFLLFCIVHASYSQESDASLKTLKSTALQKHRLWLNMTNTEGAFKQILVGYIEGATNGIDSNFDGVSLDANPYLDFYSLNSGISLVIQGRSVPFSDLDEVLLGYRTVIDGNFTIAIDDADGEDYLTTFEVLSEKHWSSLIEKNALKKRKKFCDYLLRKGFESNLVYGKLRELETLE